MHAFKLKNPVVQHLSETQVKYPGKVREKITYMHAKVQTPGAPGEGERKMMYA